MSKLANFAVSKIASVALGGGLAGAIGGTAAGAAMGGLMKDKNGQPIMQAGYSGDLYTIDDGTGKGPQVVNTSRYQIVGEKGNYDLIPLIGGVKTKGARLDPVTGEPVGATRDAILKALQGDQKALKNYMGIWSEAARPVDALAQGMTGAKSPIPKTEQTNPVTALRKEEGTANVRWKKPMGTASALGDMGGMRNDIAETVQYAAAKKTAMGTPQVGYIDFVADWAAQNKGGKGSIMSPGADSIRKSVGLKTALG